MTKEEHIKDALSDCSNSAIDCRDAAASADYDFRNSRIEKAKGGVALLEQRLSSLKAAMDYLEHVQLKP